MSLTRFNGLDEYSRAALRRLASNWRESPQRPVVSGQDAEILMRVIAFANAAANVFSQTLA